MTSAPQFDAATHIYSMSEEIIPSVTGVLADSGIISYSAVPEGTRMAAMERGTVVHQICQLHDENDLEERTVDPSLEGYLKAWRKFRKEAVFSPVRIEQRVFHPSYRYAGTLDRTGFLGLKAQDCLLDIKTGHAEWWVAVQTAAYAACIPNPMAYRRMGVELHDDGTYKVTEFKCSDYPRDFNVFAAALTVYRAKRRKQQ